MDWNTLNINLLNSPTSILSFILEETVLCLLLDLILAGAVYGSSGTVNGSGSGATISLMTCGAACSCGRCGGSELVVNVVTLRAESGISVLVN